MFLVSTFFHPANRILKVVSFWIFLLIRLGLELRLGLVVRGKGRVWVSYIGPKKKCGFPVSSYKNLGRVGRF